LPSNEESRTVKLASPGKLTFRPSPPFPLNAESLTDAMSAMATFRSTPSPPLSSTTEESTVALDPATLTPVWLLRATIDDERLRPATPLK
jgi:hypothetical protein